MVSELVTNAAVHARPRCDGDLIILALIRSADLFHVEVTDPGNPFSTPHVPDGMPYDTQSGRGLGIVCAISKRRWGVRDHGVLGRTVWCVIDARPTPGDSSAVPPCA